MPNAERVVREMPMPVAGAVAGAPGKREPAEFVERRRSAATPLVFESVERRRANLEQAGIDLMQEAARAQEEAAVLEGLRAQVRAFPAQLDAARTQARIEARHEWRAEFEDGIDRERAAMAKACAQVALERERYFSEVEGEVVRLALAIAARVLHREAKLDAMLLAASVRLALEKVASETGTVLRVPFGTEERWRTTLAEGGEPVPEVVGDERLAPGECVMETTVGRVELGVAVQLEEIEKGFFDLLQKRPS